MLRFGQAEDANGRLGEGVALGGAATDRVVLGEDDPIFLLAFRSQTSSARSWARFSP